MLLCAQPSMKRPPSHQTETTTMIQSKRKLLTALAFSFTVGRENPTVSMLFAIVTIPSVDFFISTACFSANNPCSFDLRAMSVKTKEHFYTGIPIIRSKLLQGCMLSFTDQYTLVEVGLTPDVYVPCSLPRDAAESPGLWCKGWSQWLCPA